MKNMIKKIGAVGLVVAMFLTIFYSYTYVLAQEDTEQEDIDLYDAENILAWIRQNIPEDLNELANMPSDWWEALLPNQRRVAENLAGPANRREEYMPSTIAYEPIEGDQVAYMKLESTGVQDGYGRTLWRISNGGINVFCLDHGASCRQSYAYGNFEQINGSTAYLIEEFGYYGPLSQYIAVQMAIWALQSASTEEEAYAYAYTWYLKSYDEEEAGKWADLSMTFFRMARTKNGTAWKAEGPGNSQSVGKYSEFVTEPYKEDKEPGEGEPDPETPEYEHLEDSIQVTYRIKIKKTDWQTNVGLDGCRIDIYENDEKTDTVTTGADGMALFETVKSKNYRVEYCSNYDELSPGQQETVSGFTSRSEAEAYVEEQKSIFSAKKYRYRCEEATAPEGYVWQLNERSAELAGNETSEFSITNERTLGMAELVKYDTESETCSPQGDALIDGAVYGIFAREDIIHQDGQTGVLYEKDELVQRAVIGQTPKRDEDGYLLNEDGTRHLESPEGSLMYEITPGETLFGDLELGKYYIKEIAPAEGYMLDETVYDVTFTYQDQMIKVIYRDEDASDAVNTLQADDESDSKIVYSGDYVIKQGIRIVKTADNDYQTELKPVEGAGFSVYRISDLSIAQTQDPEALKDILTYYDHDFTKEPRASLYKRGKETWLEGDKKWLRKLSGNRYEVTEMFTDADGMIETPELSYGAYVIVETTTPEGYVSAKPFITYITKDGGVLYSDISKQKIEKEYTLEDSIRYGDREDTKEREGRKLQKQRIINNTVTETYLRIVKADEEFLIQPGSYIQAEEVVRGTVLKENAKFRLRCLSLDTSEESLRALNWNYDSQGYLSYYSTAAKKFMGTEENPYSTTFLESEGKIKDSYITLPQKIPAGTYELIEIAAPKGYVLNGMEQSVQDLSTGMINAYEIISAPKSKLQFEITNGTVYPDGQMGTNKYALYDSYGNLTVTILQKNQQQKGIVEIYKHGEQLAQISEDKQFVYEDAPVKGAEFQIIAEEDIYSQELEKEFTERYEVDRDKYLIYRKGDVAAQITTDRNGWGYASDLYIGKYKIVEMIAGESFVLNRTEKSFEITPQDQTVSFDIYSADYENERQKLEIQVKKTDKETGKLLMGALYGLYAAEDIHTNIQYCQEKESWVLSDQPRVAAKKGTLLAVAATNKDGMTVFDGDIPLGNYEIRELKAPAGYLLSDKTVFINGTYDSAKGGQMEDMQIHQVQFKNTRMEIFPEEKPQNPPPQLPRPMLPAPTGDYANIFLWMSILLIAFKGLKRTREILKNL